MARKRTASLTLPNMPRLDDARRLVIDSGYGHACIVHAGREFDPVAAFDTLSEARAAYPAVPLTDAARDRSVREHMEGRKP